jgi:hypothetical protein
LHEVELELARKDQERERQSVGNQSTAEETMTEYLMLGLEIEGQQYVILISLYFCVF